MQRSKQLLIAAASAACAQLALWQFTAQAASFTWDGGGADDKLSTPANWVGDATPSSADVAIFTGSTRTSPLVDLPTQYLGLTFDPLASAFTFGGSSTLTLGTGVGSLAGSLINNSAFAQTFNNPLALTAGTINAGSAGLVFNGLVNIGAGGTVSANAVRITGASTVLFNGGLVSSIQTGSTALNIGGPVSGGNDVASLFSGTAIFSGDNSTFTGNVFIDGGAVRLTHGNALGSTGTITTALSSGGTGKGVLELEGNITVTKNVVTRARSGIGEVMIRNISGNNTITNVYTNTGGSTFSYESSAGNLTITNWNTSATGTGRFLNLLGNGNGQIVNWVAPPASTTLTINKSGGGTWTLGAGMNTGTFIAVNVNGGTLVFDGGLGTRMMGSATISAGGTLRVVSTDGTSGEIGTAPTPTSITVRSGGAFDASTFTTYSLQPGASAGVLGQSLVLGGTFTTGTLAVFGDNVVRLGDSAAAGSVGTGHIVGNLSLSNAFAATGGGIYFDLANVTTVGGGVNDLLSVQGDVMVDGSSGPINLYLNPISAAFATGTYRLIEFSSGATLNASDFAIQGFSAGQSRQTAAVATAPGQVNLVVSGNVANLVWVGNGAGNEWDVATTQNWLNGATPDKFFLGDHVTFNDTSTNTTVNLIGNLLPGSIVVDTAQTYTFQGSGALIGNPTLAKSGTGTLIVVNSGTNTLGAVTISGGTLQIGVGGTDGDLGSATITNNANLVVDKSVDLTIASVIQGSGQLVKRGSGGLALTAVNTYTGATVVEAGSLRINNNASLGDVVGGTTVNAGGQLFSVANLVTAEPLVLSGEGPVAGDGALRAGGATTSTFNGSVTLAGTTTLKVDGGARLVLNGNITGSNSLTLRADGNGVGEINGVLSLGSGALVKETSGTWILTNTANTWTGGTVVSSGTLQVGLGSLAGSLGTGSIQVVGDGTNALGTLIIDSDGVRNFAQTIVGNGAIGVGNSGGTVSFTGDLSGFNGTLTTSQGGLTSMLVVNNPSNAVGAIISDNTGGNGQGIIRLGATNALAPGAFINVQAQQVTGQGRLELANGSSITAGTINLHQRNNLTPTILALDGANTLSGNIYINFGGSLTTLSAAAGASLTVSGTIQPIANLGSNRHLRLAGDGVGTVTSTILNNADATPRGVNIIKDDSGTWTMTGPNNSNGTYAVNAGTLIVPKYVNGLIVTGGTAAVSVKGTANDPSGTSVLPNLTITGGRLDLNNNSLILTAGSLATATAQIKTALENGGNFDWLGPGIGSTQANVQNTTAGSFLYGLGVVLNDLAQVGGSGPIYTDFAGVSGLVGTEVLVKFTYFGDADLSGSIDATDYSLIDNGYVNTLSGWINGDFDYSGVIDATDYALIDNAYVNQAGPLAEALIAEHTKLFGGEYVAALRAIQSGVVPEPATMGLLLGAAWSLQRPRRRRDC
ncbi:beta strand repeat-containing protein [Fontivita pretiosa]|uniref:beta strand repeat-containing protein n=1 Tax=Fontivita pretiosa TaxID=2989684 RepID=UPI003D16D191